MWQITPSTPVRPISLRPKTTSYEITYKKAETLSGDTGLHAETCSVSPCVVALLIAGAIYYQRVQERRQVQAAGILTDAMMQLEASNEYIAAIFDCYKSLVKHFKKYGFMKGLQTAREFEAAVRRFSMMPMDQLDDFLSIFEERYSEHTIDATHRTAPCKLSERCEFVDHVTWRRNRCQAR